MEKGIPERQANHLAENIVVKRDYIKMKSERTQKKIYDCYNNPLFIKLCTKSSFMNSWFYFFEALLILFLTLISQIGGLVWVFVRVISKYYYKKNQLEKNINFFHFGLFVLYIFTYSSNG